MEFSATRACTQQIVFCTPLHPRKQPGNAIPIFAPHRANIMQPDARQLPQVMSSCPCSNRQANLAVTTRPRCHNLASVGLPTLRLLARSLPQHGHRPWMPAWLPSTAAKRAPVHAARLPLSSCSTCCCLLRLGQPNAHAGQRPHVLLQPLKREVAAHKTASGCPDRLLCASKQRKLKQKRNIFLC
jgi:hypothetical protein